MNQIIARAKADMQRIVLPEGTEERTLKAADKLIADKVAHITLIGNPADIMALAEKHGLQNIGNAIIVDPKNHERKEEYANLLFELRKKKGMTEEQAAKQVEDPLFRRSTKYHRQCFTRSIPNRKNSSRSQCCIGSFPNVPAEQKLRRKWYYGIRRLCRIT